MIEIKNLYKSFGEKEVLKGINLQIPDGKVTCILGGSGCGKSTLIKCLIRLEDPTSGQILVDGKDITRLNNEIRLAAIRRHFGYLFQEGALFDSMTVGENVSFGLKYLTQVPQSKYPRIIKEKLALVGLTEDVAKLNPSELSGGMKKRVSLARVLAVNPKVILYDEPTTGLDPIMSDIISDLILDLKEKLKVTSVVITHDMHSAFKIADYIAFLYEGKILLYGTPEEFRKTDNPYVKQFISDLILDLKEKLKVTSVVITHDMHSAFKIADYIAFLYEGKILLYGTPEEFRKTDNPYVKQFVSGSSHGPIQMKLMKE